MEKVRRWVNAAHSRRAEIVIAGTLFARPGLSVIEECAPGVQRRHLHRCAGQFRATAAAKTTRADPET